MLFDEEKVKTEVQGDSTEEASTITNDEYRVRVTAVEPVVILWS